MRPDIPPVIEEKHNIEEKNPFDKIKNKEYLKDFLIIYFSDQVLVSSPDSDELRVIKNKNNDEIKFLLNQYGLASNLINQDPSILKDLVEIEDKLYSLGHSISKEDFSYVKDISNEDIELFIKVFGSKDFNFRLNTWGISLDEALVFLRYTKNSNQTEFDRIIEYKKKYGVQPFLSMLYGEKIIGDKILTLSEKLPEEIAKKVFEKYGEIIDKANNTEEEIKKIFGYENVPVKVLTSVKDTLLKRGAKMLSDLGDKVMDEKFVVNEQEILDELDEIKEETIILGESCAKLYREGIKVPIEDVTEIEEISVLKLTAEEKKELLKVYVNGRPKVTYENQGHLKMLENEFEQELNNKDTSVFNIRFNGNIIIFAIVDKKDKDTLYVGGLTFVDDVRNPVVAEASMNLVLERFKNYNIKALVDSKNPILAMYQKRFGFNIVGELPRVENAGELYYEIVRSKKKEERKIEKERELEKAA